MHASNTFILTAGQMGCPRTWGGKMIRMAMVVALFFAASGGAHAQDIFGDPHYGTARLESGFTPDPHEVDVAVGGSVSASRLGRGCAGFISDRPDFRLRFDTSGWLPLYIWVESNTDTTLVINDPDGDWSCDDDSARGVNPYVKFASPSSGTYDIWIGAFSEENNFEDAILRISELNIQ